ncbi:hypothetical protein Glove_33g176 [Diversispora epigaea]|uniref:Uncharacterized protein n=1 Tax=Diversispora epigaea TaxID=1348612 RepID=A0A397JH61_9GLOM|nr:hypothetical protein Glove_33g176 [Diversispora epigaea]
MDNLTIEDNIQKENIPFYKYSEFQNVLPLLKFLKKLLLLKIHRKLEIHESMLKFYSITKQDNTNNYVYDYEYVNESSFRQYLKNHFPKNAKINLANQITKVLMLMISFMGNSMINRYSTGYCGSCNTSQRAINIFNNTSPNGHRINLTKVKAHSAKSEFKNSYSKIESDAVYNDISKENQQQYSCLSTADGREYIDYGSGEKCNSLGPLNEGK